MKWRIHKKKPVNFQAKLKDPIVQIFPLENDFTAAILSKEEGSPFTVVSVHKHNSKKLHLFASGPTMVILPNGSYLSSIKPNTVNTLHHFKQKLSNVCHDAEFYIREALDDTLLTAIDNERFLAVSADQCAVYYYDLNKRIKKSLSGFCNYILDNIEEKIVSISSSQHQGKILIALALNSGLILLGELDGHQFAIRMQMNQQLQYGKNVELFLSAKGYLVIYFADKKLLKIWDIENPGNTKQYTSLELTHLKLSSSGDFFTALRSEGVDEQTRFGLVFDLKNRIQHTLAFHEVVSDFAMGYKNRICKSIEGTLEYSDYLSQFFVARKSTFSSLPFFKKSRSPLQDQDKGMKHEPGSISIKMK